MEIVSDFDLGQHFLIDKKIIDKEIDVADLSKEDRVIEIGAGKGLLTEALTKKAGEVLSFEVDKKLAVFLELIEKKHKNLKVVYDDALKHSWRGYNKMVSNIPYYLTESIIRKAIESNIEELVLVVGENFKEAIERDSDKLGITVNSFFDFKFVMPVKRSSFEPKPRVDSWLIKVKRKEKPTKEERVLQQLLVKKGKIKNVLMRALADSGMTKNQAKGKIQEMKIHDSVLNKPIDRITGRFLEEFRKKLNSL